MILLRDFLISDIDIFSYNLNVRMINKAMKITLTAVVVIKRFIGNPNRLMFVYVLNRCAEFTNAARLICFSGERNEVSLIKR